MKHYKKLFWTIPFLALFAFLSCKNVVSPNLPDISVFPNSLSVTLDQGETSKKWIIISNEGGLSLPFDISIEFEDTLSVLEFDGIDDYVEVPDHPSLSAIGGAFTLECWLKVGEDPIQTQEILGKWGSGGSYNDEYGLDIPTSSILELAISGASGGMTEIRSNSTISPYTWTHFAGVFDSASTSLKLFINGILESDMTPSTLTMNRDTDEPFRMGTYDFSFHSNFKGQMKEVRIWNIARTQAEIQANMNQELSGTETGLVGYWKLNEGSGNTVYDSSPNNNDGTLHGGLKWGITWLSADTTSGIVPSDGEAVVEVTFDATILNAGNYNANLIINSIDPDEPETLIPVSLTVR